MNKVRFFSYVAVALLVVGGCHVIARWWIADFKSQWVSGITVWNLGEVHAKEWIAGYCFGLLAIFIIVALLVVMKESNDMHKEKMQAH